MSKGLWMVTAVAVLASFAPIWRGAGHSRFDGVSFWRLLRESTELTWQKDSRFGHPHITYQEAVQQAHQAWLEHCGVPQV